MEEGTPFMKNGCMLLKKLVAFCNGRHNPVRMYSQEEIRKATGNFAQHQCFMVDGEFHMYRGFLKNRLVVVKKFSDFLSVDRAVNDIVVGLQMSSHKNVLKLSGCCLETVPPVLVYEFLQGYHLYSYFKEEHGLEFCTLSWKSRLRIARELAHAFAYLHNAFDRPVVHRQIQPSRVFLDQDYRPKLIDFSLSKSIPEGQQHVQDPIVGTTGTVAPEYFFTGSMTEKSDVYSFGMLLFVLLTGQQFFWQNLLSSVCGNSFEDRAKYCVEHKRVSDIVDPALVEDVIEQQQLLEFAKIALGCINLEGEDRPTMMEVAKQLKQLDLRC